MGPGLAVAGVIGAGLGPWLPSLARRCCTSHPQLGVRAGILATVSLVALLAVVAVRIGPQPPALGYLVLAVAGVVLSVVDLVERRLPDVLVWPTAAAVVLLLAAAALLELRPLGAVGAVAGAIGLFVVYLVLALITRGGIGMGDVKLAAACGAALGFLGVRTWLVGLAAGFLLNGLASVVALALRRTTLRGSLPFGPAMIAGVFVAMALT